MSLVPSKILIRQSKSEFLALGTTHYPIQGLAVLDADVREIFPPQPSTKATRAPFDKAANDYLVASMNQDQEHLRLLSIFHYVMGGMTALFALFPLIYVIIGGVMVAGGMSGSAGSPPPPPAVGWFMIAIGVGVFLIGETMAACTIAAGRFLSARTHRVFCIVIAALHCLHAPFGTLLGVFTLIVLVKPSVRMLFDDAPAPIAPPGPYVEPFPNQ